VIHTGYLNNAELTDSVFLQDPFIPDSTMMYRTGDLARYHDDGIIEYLGRNDFQIKLRGLRIELGEIESCLLAQDQIKQAVVSTRNSGSDEILVAYLVQEGEQSSINLLSKDSLKTDELKSALSTTLPSYMIPQMFFFLSELPLTASGKIDLKALQALELQRPSVQDQAANLSSTDSPSTVLPNTESEIYLRDLWCELLDIDGVFINDNFFDIGGHSLLAVNATLQIKKDKGREVPVQAFISNTLGQIANQYLDASDEALKAQQKQQKKANWLTSLFKR